MGFMIPVLLLVGASVLRAQTDFGAVDVGSTVTPVTVTLTLSAAGTIAAPDVLTKGAPNLDFTDAGTGTCTTNGTAHAYQAGDTCTVSVKFAPRYAGVIYGAVALHDNSSPAKLMATAYLQGTGNGPQTIFIGNQVKTPLGSGFISPRGVAVDGAGNVFVTDHSKPGVAEIMAAGGYTTVKWLPGRWSYPLGVAVDGAGNVFVTDMSANVVKEIVAEGGYTTVKTLGSGFSMPTAVAVDGAGNVIVADYWPGAVKRMVAADGYTTVKYLGSGWVTPAGVAVDGAGNIFVADDYLAAVKELVAADGYVNPKTIWSGSAAPALVAFDGTGNLFLVARTSNNTYPPAYPLWEITAASGYTRVLTLDTGDYQGLAVDGAGNVFIVSYTQHMPYRLGLADPPSVSFATTIAGTTSTDSYKTVTAQNVGNKPLDISAVSYPTDFPEASGVKTDCTSTTSLNGGDWCSLSINFSPLPASLSGESTQLNETVSLTDNHLNGTDVVQSLPVKGVVSQPQPPSLTAPAASAVLSGSTKFTWDPGLGFTEFQLRVGTGGPGSYDIYYSGVLTRKVTSATVTIPANGLTLNVGLWYMVSGKWSYKSYTFKEGGTPTLPSLTSPTASPLSGSTSFKWSPGVGSQQFQLRVGIGGVGSHDIYYSGVVANTVTSATVTIPANGVKVFVGLYYLMNGTWSSKNYTFTEGGTATPPSLTSPTASPLSGSTSFKWSPGAGSYQFQLRIGVEGPGSHDIYYSGVVANTATSATVPIPANGVTVFVGLYYLMNGTWSSKNYTFTEGGTSTRPSLTSPTASPVSGSTSFKWSPGVGSYQFRLCIGIVGPSSHDIYDSGVVANTVTSETVTIPANGVTLFVALYYLMNGTWDSKSYTFTEGGTPTPPSLISPTASPLSGSTNFKWNPGVGSSQFQLHIGIGGPGTQDVYNSGVLPNSVTSKTVTIPANGAKLDVGLFYMTNGTWHAINYTFTEGGTPTPPSLTSPTASVLSGPTSFTWNPGGGSYQFQLRVGVSGVGSRDIYYSDVLPNSVTSKTVTIPANGAKLYVSLWYLMNGTWSYINYTFKEAGTPPSLTSPSAAFALSGPTKFEWNPGAGSSGFQLRVGIGGVGSHDIYFSGVVANTVTSETVSVPANGVTVFVGLYYMMNGTWSSKNYTFTEGGTRSAPTLTSPTASPLSRSTNFTWSPGVGSYQFQLRVGTLGVGSYDVYYSGVVANTVTSETVTIPSKGATLWVGLYYLMNGTWSYKSYTFTEGATATPSSVVSGTASLLSGVTRVAWNSGGGRHTDRRDYPPIMEALEILRGPEPLERALDASTFASGEFILDQ